MERIDTLLLLALPASGKSELRRYLEHLDPDVAATDFGLGPTVDLDDYPYVHLMRRISEVVRSLDAAPVFFAANELVEIAGGRVSYKQVGQDLSGRGLQVLLERYAPGADTGESLLRQRGIARKYTNFQVFTPLIEALKLRP